MSGPWGNVRVMTSRIMLPSPPPNRCKVAPQAARRVFRAQLAGIQSYKATQVLCVSKEVLSAGSSTSHLRNAAVRRARQTQ